MAETISSQFNRFFNTLDNKIEKHVKNHLKDVYGSLAVSLMAAAAGAYVHVATDLLRGSFLTGLLAFGALMLLYGTPATKGNESLRLGYLIGFAGLSGLGVGPLLDVVIDINPSIVSTAFMSTCLIFLCFTLAALYAPDLKFLYLGGILMSALSTLFWVGLIGLFTGSHLLFQAQLYIGFVVMCGFILYDTQMIMEKRRRGDTDYVWHSVELFIDFLSIFRRLLIILAQKEVDRMQSALKLLVDCRCVIPSAFIFGAAPVYFVGAVGWQAIAIFLPQRVFNVVDDFMYSCYQRLVLFFFENMAGVKISFYGDVDECFSRKENVLYFSNHQSNVDWVIANMLSVRQGSLGHLRYILKDGLQYIPLYGWYFWQHGCVYVRRKGAFRVDIAEKGLNYLKGLKTPVWLAIFPEGTRYYPHKEKEIASSREYALKQTITPLEQHLTPRSRGFHMVMSKLKDKLDAVYDVTVVYSSTRSADGESRGAAPSLFEYVAGGRNDLHLHLHVKRYPIAEVPYETEEEVLSWLHDRFLEKDRYLNAFHSVNYRPGDPVFPNLVERDACLPLRSTLPSFLFFAGSLVPLLLTAVGRSLYWKVWVFGTLSGYAWMKIRQAA